MITAPKDAKQINPAARDDGIQLPFYAPVIYWRNGNKALSQVGGVGHFGGWESQDFDAAFSERGGLPSGFNVEERFFGNVWASRSILFVPVSARFRWIEADNKSHNQVLVVLATQENKEIKEIKEWGTAVLSYKGKSTKDKFEKATKDWDKETRQLRIDLAGGMPAWYFYRLVGTFGEFVEIEVGTKPKSSMITPMSLYVPEMSQTVIEKSYVGDDLYTRMSELHESAKEWANDSRWKGNEENLLEKAPVVGELGGVYNQAEEISGDLSVDEAFPPESDPFA
ncbi:MAG: hypothetical protein HOJ31_10175 [Anaerolineae bacterium]|jgi:hypothetical protein|nr:hypothetical protein [Anaerolineae bacterium]